MKLNRLVTDSVICLIILFLASSVSSFAEIGRKTIFEGSADSLSVRVKDVDLKDFLIALAEIGKINMVINPGVKGKVTLSLQNVSWREALEAALFFNDLSYVEIGSNGIIGPYEKMKSMAGRLDGMLSAPSVERKQDETPITLTYPMPFETAKALWPQIRRMLSPKGRYLYNETSHCVHIVDVKENAQIIMDFIISKHVSVKESTEK